MIAYIFLAVMTALIIRDLWTARKLRKQIDALCDELEALIAQDRREVYLSLIHI